MFHRRPAPPPAAPLGLGDLEETPRGPLISGRNLLRAAGILLAAIAWGAAVRLADSLPIDLGFIAFVLKVGRRLRLRARAHPLAPLPGLRGGSRGAVRPPRPRRRDVGLNAGPTVVPAATVTGDFSFAPSVPAGTPATAGALACEWANGHWKIGTLRTITPLAGLPTPHVLTIDFLRWTMSLADGKGSNLMAVGNEAFVSPADAPPAAPAIAAGRWTSTCSRWRRNPPPPTRGGTGPIRAGLDDAARGSRRGCVGPQRRDPPRRGLRRSSAPAKAREPGAAATSGADRAGRSAPGG